MGAIATGVVEGTISAASYAATETLAYGRDVSFGDVLSVGLNNGIMAGCMKDIMQSIGLCNCFIAGTLVATETGYVTIENIKVGDLVWAHDPETGETALKPVVQTFRNETTEWIHVTVNGERITCTPEHPFYSPVKGWTSAIDLRAGDILVMLNGEYVVVEQVQHELLEGSETTYNFEVEGFHTYHVGEQSLLVHNLCKQELVKTEVHHVVEQCQKTKSGFSNAQIQASSNKVTLDYSVHRKISGFYSSKQPSITGSTTMRVRDWLAGQSFEAQTKFGWEIIRRFGG